MQEIYRTARTSKNFVKRPTDSITVAEPWLSENPTVLAELKKAIKQADAGDLHDLGSFIEYADDELDTAEEPE